MNQTRIKKLQKSIVNPLLIKKKENLQYLIGVSFENIDGYLLIKKDDLVFFGSGLEKVESVKKVDRFKNIGKYLSKKSNLDIEYSFTYGEGKYLNDKLPGVKINPVISLASLQRQIKGKAELDAVRESMQIVERVFKLVRKEILKPGMTEIKLAKFIESSGMKFGAEKVSFPAIVASGSNAAVPHHIPSSKVLKSGESIILDFGFKYKNYCSDFTRTVFLKSVPKKLEIAYNQVEKAYNESINFISSNHPASAALGTPTILGGEATVSPSFQKRGLGGINAGDVYQKAVDILEEKHLSKYFIHSLGHGTGLEIHELPNLSPKSKDIMKDGMVFSIEPGVYFPKVGGIRIEDLVYLENGKVKKFINISTKLEDNIL
jgi:Xaa-Pro aminopeptidase